METFADILHGAFEGFGTDSDDTVARIFGSNDRQTVKAIAEKYAEKYEPLQDALGDEISGDFGQVSPDALILALVRYPSSNSFMVCVPSLGG